MPIAKSPRASSAPPCPSDHELDDIERIIGLIEQAHPRGLENPALELEIRLARLRAYSLGTWSDGAPPSAALLRRYVTEAYASIRRLLNGRRVLALDGMCLDPGVSIPDWARRYADIDHLEGLSDADVTRVFFCVNDDVTRAANVAHLKWLQTQGAHVRVVDLSVVVSRGLGREAQRWRRRVNGLDRDAFALGRYGLAVLGDEAVAIHDEVEGHFTVCSRPNCVAAFAGLLAEIVDAVQRAPAVSLDALPPRCAALVSNARVVARAVA